MTDFPPEQWEEITDRTKIIPKGTPLRMTGEALTDTRIDQQMWADPTYMKIERLVPPAPVEPELQPGDVVGPLDESDERRWTAYRTCDSKEIRFVQYNWIGFRTYPRKDLPDQIRILWRKDGK